MTLTLYHCSGARSVRPLWTLLEMGLEHKLITLQFPPRVHNKEFKEINPLGTVPCLIDGSLNMTESAGICLSELAAPQRRHPDLAADHLLPLHSIGAAGAARAASGGGL